MLDALPELVNRWRIGDLTIRYCNAAWASQYGIYPADAVGRHVQDFLSDHELEGLRDQLARTRAGQAGAHRPGRAGRHGIPRGAGSSGSTGTSSARTAREILSVGA